MKCKVVTRSPEETSGGTLALVLHAAKKGVVTPTGLSEALRALIDRAVTSKAFSGKVEEVCQLVAPPDLAVDRLLLVGIGTRGEGNLEEALRRGAAAATRAVGRDAAFTLALPDSVMIDGGERAAEAAVIGRLLATYRFDRHKDKKTRDGREAAMVLAVSEDQAKAARAGAKRGQGIASGVRLARDLGNLPGNLGTPRILASEARKMARKTGLKCSVLDERRMKDLGMGSLLSVAKGSTEPPRMIVLEHGKDKRRVPTVCIVGKGLTFDSGGISIKPSADMDKMRYDKCGGCAVIGTMEAVAALDLPVHLIGIVPSSENMPGPAANKPGDVVTAMNGKTIQVLNTDAEGRLILADALCYAQRYEPELIIDLATLTGAVLVALGQHMAGMMGTDEAAMKALSAAGEATHERVWQLPLDPDYDEAMRGDTSDLKNLGGRYAGTITAGQFLKHFTSDRSWVHLDIAGVAWDDPKRVYNKGSGATGWAVRLLVRFLEERLAAGRRKPRRS